MRSFGSRTRIISVANKTLFCFVSTFLFTPSTPSPNNVGGCHEYKGALVPEGMYAHKGSVKQRHERWLYQTYIYWVLV